MMVILSQSINLRNTTVSKHPTKRLDLIISLFESSNTASVYITCNSTRIPVQYTYTQGRHVVKLGKTDVKLHLDVLGRERVIVEAL